MPQIRAGIGSSGLSVVSTFSGCGGSCLGFEMAGYSVLWANEFVAAARDVYARNHPGVILDERDIRDVKPEDVLRAIGKAAGDVDVLEGSPPCSTFSMSGKREKWWGQVKTYSNTAQRVDDLFFEYVRLLEGIRPRVFVAENVVGLVKGKAYGYFELVLRAMRACGYQVRAKVLDAQWLGVPQDRKRLFFVGVREDLEREPAFPAPLPYRYTVREALAGCGSPTEETLELAGTAIGREWEKLVPGVWSERYQNLIRVHPDKPCPTVTALGGDRRSVASITHPTEPRKFTIFELRRLCGFPDDFELTGKFAQQWERLGRSVPPVMMSHVATTLRDKVLL